MAQEKQYEFMFVTMPLDFYEWTSDFNFNDLNDHGAMGWQMVSVVARAGGYVALFQRESE